MSTPALAFTPYALGDVNYVPHLNSDFSNIESAVNYLLTTIASLPANTFGGAATAWLAMFGSSVPCLIGTNSLAASIIGGVTTSVLPGYCWCPLTQGIVTIPGTTNLSGAGLVSGVYYVSLSSSGVITLQATAVGSVLYTVNWTGSVFNTLVRVATVFMDASAETLLLTSTEDATMYPTVLARLEADETSIATLSTNQLEVRVVSLTIPSSVSMNLTAPHGVTGTIKGVSLSMTSAGAISFQSPSTTWDGTNVYVTGSAYSVTGIALVFYTGA